MEAEAGLVPWAEVGMRQMRAPELGCVDTAANPVMRARSLFREEIMAT
jgi:hypothetical protein